MTERTIDVYGGSLASVKRNVSATIEEQARAGWELARMNIRKAEPWLTPHTHAAEVILVKAKP